MDVLALLAGIVGGALSGLVPGLHNNTLTAALMVSGLPAAFLVVVVIALAASHQIFEFIPAIFLGVPDSETVVSVLPGHRLLLMGKGLLALRLVAASCLFALVISVAALPLVAAFLPAAYAALEPWMFWVLLVAVGALLWTERKPKLIAAACLVFGLSGALGALVLAVPFVTDPLLPALSGLFAISAALLAMSGRVKIPPQQTADIDIKLRAFGPYILLGCILGAVVGLLPGLGVAQAAVLALIFVPVLSAQFLALVASISISNLVYGFAALATIGKARSGAAVAVRDLLGTIDPSTLAFIIGIIVVSIAVSIVFLLLLARPMLRAISTVDPLKLNAAVLLFLTALIWTLTGLV